MRHLQKNKHRGAAENIIFKSSQRSLSSHNNYLVTIFSFIGNWAVKPNNRFIAIKKAKTEPTNRQAAKPTQMRSRGETLGGKKV